MNADRNKLNQVIQHFFTKCAQVIVQSRQAPQGAGSSSKPNKWFNLTIDDLDSLRDELKGWRGADPAEFSSLVIETIVSAKSVSPRQKLVLHDLTGRAWPVDKHEVVLERWVIEFKPSSGTDIDVAVVYKRAIIAIRALYSLCRLLPAWTLRRKLVRQKLASSPLKIDYKVLDGAEPISSKGRVGLSKRIGSATEGNDEPVMTSRSLTSIVVPTGTLNITVSYRTNTNFKTDDVESVIAQQLLELDVGAASPPKPSSDRSRPIVSFTRPFRTSDAGSSHSVASVASVGSHMSHTSVSAVTPRRTPSATSITYSTGQQATAGSSAAPVPVPLPSSQGSNLRDNLLTSSASSSSSIPRFSSSFASRGIPNRRSGSIESRHRPLSVAGSVSSVASSLEPASGLYMPQADVGDFVRFVDDTQKRASGAFKSSRTSLDGSLSRFHTMRQSHIQLSESMAMSIAEPRQPASPVPGHASTVSFKEQPELIGGQPYMTSQAWPQSRSRSGSRSRSESRSISSTPPPGSDQMSDYPNPSSSALSPMSSPPAAHTRSSRLSQSPTMHSDNVASSGQHDPGGDTGKPQAHESGAGSLGHAPHVVGSASRYSHLPATPSRLSEEFTVPRRSSSSAGHRHHRLSFYNDDSDAKTKREEQESRRESRHESEDELLFAFSDMSYAQ